MRKKDSDNNTGKFNFSLSSNKKPKPDISRATGKGNKSDKKDGDKK